MDRLDAMSIFVEVVDAGSFAAAARKVGCSPASVTRAIAQLESSAAERLIERSTRHLRVTEAGQRHVESYRRMLDELALIDGAEPGGGVNGTLVVTAPELFGRMHVLPMVESFLGQHPRARVRVLLQNRMMDLVGEGVDVAIRLAHLPASSLTAVKLGEVRKIFCASPAYLARHGCPAHPGDLVDHACIGLNDQGQQELWQYREGASGRSTRSVRVNCQLSLNSAAAGIETAERGVGILHPISYQVQRQLVEGSLHSVLDAYTQEPMPVHLVFASRERLSPVARTFIDHAAPLLRDVLRG